jgi:predicted dehydrogenase
MSAAGRLPASPAAAPQAGACPGDPFNQGVIVTTSSSRPRKVGLVGFGAAGAYFHAPFIAATPGLQLAAIVTRDAARAAKARAEYPGVAVHDRPEALWTAAPEIDLVVVATPNSAHVPIARAAVDAGLAVVVDKPLAVTSADARDLIDRARARGVMLTVFQNRRYDGDFQTLRQLIAEGQLGEPLRFESRFERWRLVPKPGWRESGDPGEGGGLLMDLGSHLVDQATQLFGPVASIYAETDRRRPGVAVDDDVFVALTHRSGVRSHLWMSVLASQHGPRFRLLGSTGSYVKFGLDGQEDALRAGRRPASEEAWGDEPQERWGTIGDLDDRRPVRTLRGHYGQFYAGVEDALRHGTAPPVDPEDAWYTLRVIELARQAAAERQLVACE